MQVDKIDKNAHGYHLVIKKKPNRSLFSLAESQRITSIFAQGIVKKVYNK